MARYIDADELLKELQEELDFETPMYTEEQNKYFNSGLRCAIRDVKKAPPADVVPKSEVASGVLTTDNSTLTDVIKHYQKVYAREIFEEIEKLKHTKWDWNDYVDWDAIAELKKKYTKSEDKG